MFWRILASVSFRQLPLASVSMYIFYADDMAGGGGGSGPDPKSLGHLSAQIPVFSAVLLYFSFRQLPPASVSTYIVPFGQHDMWGEGGGPEAKVSGPLLP